MVGGDAFFVVQDFFGNDYVVVVPTDATMTTKGIEKMGTTDSCP
jgi:hypothetical protein